MRGGARGGGCLSIGDLSIEIGLEWKRGNGGCVGVAHGWLDFHINPYPFPQNKHTNKQKLE